MNKIFICYSHKDHKSKERLETHLLFFEKQGQLTFWSDEQISCGENWDPEIIKAISESSAAILLISADFLASDYIQNKELPIIFQRRQNEGMKVFPFILYQCNWQEHKFIPKINARPKEGKPLHSLKTKNEKEDAWTKFTSEIKSLLSSELSTEVSEKGIDKEDNLKLTLKDKLYNLTKRFYPLEVLKPNLLIKLNPFNENIKPKQSHHINRFSMKIANDEIVNLINDWNEAFLDNPNSKTSEVINFLRNNLIFSVSNSHFVEFNLHHSPIKCSCLLCKFENLDFNDLDNQITQNNQNYLEGKEITEQLQNAYINFRVFNLTESYYQIKKILSSVKNESNHDKKYIIEFICKSNLKNLHGLFLNTKFEVESQEILKEFEEPNFYNYLFDENLDENILKQLEYISNGRFLKDISNKVDKSLNKIRISVDAKANVQYHIDELIYNTAFLVSFTQKNYLFHEIFDDFNVIVEKALDGIFAAYSVQDNIPKIRIFDRLGSYMKIEINEFILSLCVFYCNTDILIGILNRYKLKQLPISPDYLINRALNICDTPEMFDKYNMGNNYRYLFRRFQPILENLLFLISLTNDSDRLTELFSKVICILKNSRFRFTFKGFNYLLQSKGKFINHEDIISLLKITIEKYNNEEIIFQIATEIYYSRFKSLKIEDKNYIDKILEADNKNFLFYLWFIVNPNLQEKIKCIIEESLQSQFAFNFFFNFSFNEIISYKKYLDQALDHFKIAKNKGLYEKVGDIYITDDYNDFNYFIQLVYKYKIQLPEDFNKIFEEVSEYHKFLLNPEKYDYDKFETEWFFVFQKEDYWQRFRKIEKLKNAVNKVLTEKYSNELAEVFYKYLN